MKRFLFLIVMLCVVIGCRPKSQSESKSSKVIRPAAGSVKAEIKEGEDFRAFYIYQDKGSRNNHYTPSGFMPDGQCLSLNESASNNCFSGESCIKISYDVACSRKGERWAGVYWLNPPNNWGKRKGGYNLKGASRLTFRARGERGGEQIQEFTVGGITGDYPDSDMISMGPVIFSKEWKEYSLDLRGKDLSCISGGFSWTTNVDVNSQPVIFYLDEIKFE